MTITPHCASCKSNLCLRTPMSDLASTALPSFCPMRLAPEVVKASETRYQDQQAELYIQSTINERDAYQSVRGTIMGVRPRVKEIAEFAKLLDAKRVGIAFCIGLKDEAAKFSEYLEEEGLTVASVCCKCGGVDKTHLGLDEQHKIYNPGGFEAGCNPIVQADLLAQAKTKFNIIVGLCVGHDMLFTLNSKVPVTTAIVKDRLLGHNPVIALYSEYHKKVIRQQKSR